MTEVNQPVPKIRVTSGYRSQNTNMQYIPEGEYEVGDPRLFGQSDFLLQSGRAVQLDEKGNATQITVTAGAADRDLSGKPIVVKVGQDQGILSNTIPPVYAQFPNNADASQVIQPYEIGSTEPAAIMGAEAKLVGASSGKTEVAARQEAAVTAAAIPEAQAVREQAAQAADDSVGKTGDELDAKSDDELFELAKQNGQAFAEVPSRADLLSLLRKPAAENPSTDVYAAMNVDQLRDEVKRLELTVRDDDGNTVAVSKANRTQLLSALGAPAATGS